MPLSKIALIRSTVAFLLVGMIALLAIVGATLWLVNQTRKYSDDLIAARLRRSAIVDLRGLVQDAETGQRGYLLTGNRDYLEPYEMAQRRLGPQLQQLTTLVAGDPAEKAAVEKLSALLASKLSELKETIDLVEVGRRDDALAIVKTNRGREIMDQGREIFDQVLRHAEVEVTTSVDDQQSSISKLRWVTLLGALVIIGVVGGSIWTVLLYTRQLIAAQREVQSLNVGLEERVRERTADLGRANEEIQRFAYIVTHDLRAPLVNIMGFTSELETSLAPIQAYVGKVDAADEDPAVKEARTAASEDLPEAIGFIRSSTRKMDGLINAILKLSREGRRTLKPEPIELRALLDAAAASVQHQVTESDGAISIDAKVRPLVSDRLALEQIVGNLLDNAVKYRAAGRPLRITARAHEEPGQRVVIEVEDNGRGIASQDHERVFDLFRRSGAQDKPGEGIGLAHVRAMIRTLGGQITLKSELGQGTTFRLSLPRDLRKFMGAA